MLEKFATVGSAQISDCMNRLHGVVVIASGIAPGTYEKPWMDKAIAAKTGAP